MADPEAGQPGPGAERAQGRGWRWALSLLFVVHLGSVLAYILPEGESGVEQVPETLGRPLLAASEAYVRLVGPVSGRYLNLTATRQHWTLFAPNPIAWDVSVDVVAYYPRAAGDSVWVADTLRVRGPRETPYPHLLDHRSSRLQFNLGYEVFGDAYRVHYARWQCRTLHDDRGRRPRGVVLRSVWYPTPVPWWRDQDLTPVVQELGGFDCGRLLGSAQ